MSSSSVEPPLAANFDKKKIPRRSPRLAAAANKQQIPPSPGANFEKKKFPRRSPRLAAANKQQIPPGGDPSKKKRGEKRHSSSPAHPAPERPILSPAEYRALEKDEEKRWQAFIAKICGPESIGHIMLNCYPRRPKYFDGPY